MDPNAAAMRFRRLSGMDSNSGKIVPSPVTHVYEYPDNGPDVLSWCFPDSPSAYVDEPACDYSSLCRDSQSVSSNLETFDWPAPDGFSAPLTAMTFTSGDPLLSPNTWAAETDSESYEQEALSPLHSPNAPQQFLTSPELDPLTNLKRSWSEDSITPQTSTNKPTKQSKPKSRSGRKHSLQLRTASRKPRKPSSPATATATTTTTTTTTTTRPLPTPTPTKKRSPSPLLDEDLTPEERRARRNHNLVEKQYRNRLNAQFERLLAVLAVEQQQAQCRPGGKDGPYYDTQQQQQTSIISSGGGGGGGVVVDEKRMSKAEVLDLATRRIRTLEHDRDRLVRERRELLRRVQLMVAGAQAVRQRGVGALG